MAKRSRSSHIALSIQLGQDHAPPSEFRIFRAGQNPSEKGTFLFDEKAATSVMAQYAKHGKALRFDYNHAVTYREPTPDQAIAAGSFVPEVRQGELWATQIRWTPRAAQYLANGEYCEMSPLFEHDGDNRVTRLLNVALTNLPALDDTIPLVAANANEGDDPMSCTACSAKDEEVKSLNAKLTALSVELTALKAKMPSDEDGDEMKAAKALRMEVSALVGSNSVPVALGALKALKEKADRADTLTAQLTAINTKRFDDEFASILDGAVTALKITPAERPYWEAQCKKDGHATEDGVERLRGYVGVAAPRVAMAASRTGTEGAVVLTPDEIWAAEKHGTPLEDALKFKRASLGLPAVVA